MARPVKPINWDMVHKYIECGCPAKEIAGKFDIYINNFYTKFKEHFGEGFESYASRVHENVLSDIRLMIYAKAINNKAPGNSNLLTFIAKCKLGFKEPDIVHTLAPNQEKIDESHRIIELEHKLAVAEAKNADR
jgi:hypothetical protein